MFIHSDVQHKCEFLTQCNHHSWKFNAIIIRCRHTTIQHPTMLIFCIVIAKCLIRTGCLELLIPSPPVDKEEKLRISCQSVPRTAEFFSRLWKVMCVRTFAIMTYEFINTFQSHPMSRWWFSVITEEGMKSSGISLLTQWKSWDHQWTDSPPHLHSPTDQTNWTQTQWTVWLNHGSPLVN